MTWSFLFWTERGSDWVGSIHHTTPLRCVPKSVRNSFNNSKQMIESTREERGKTQGTPAYQASMHQSWPMFNGDGFRDGQSVFVIINWPSPGVASRSHRNSWIAWSIGCFTTRSAGEYACLYIRILEVHGCVECTPYFDSYPAEDLIVWNVWNQPWLLFPFSNFFFFFASYPTSTLLFI